MICRVVKCKFLMAVKKVCKKSLVVMVITRKFEFFTRGLHFLTSIKDSPIVNLWNANLFYLLDGYAVFQISFFNTLPICLPGIVFLDVALCDHHPRQSQEIQCLKGAPL